MFVPQTNGTCVELAAEMRLGGLVRVIEPILKIVGQRETEKEFDVLKELLEAQG